MAGAVDEFFGGVYFGNLGGFLMVLSFHIMSRFESHDVFYQFFWQKATYKRSTLNHHRQSSVG